METSENLTERNTGEQLTLFAVGSLAKTFQPPVPVSVLRENGRDFGVNYSEPFARFDPVTSSWKTSQYCLNGEFGEFSATFPKSGTMRNGECFQLAKWDFHTHGKECFLLPTPEASIGHSPFSVGTAEKLANGIKFRKSGARIGSSLKWHPALLPYLVRGQPNFPNPHFCVWMMGYRTSWTDLNAQETALFPK